MSTSPPTQHLRTLFLVRWKILSVPLPYQKRSAWLVRRRTYNHFILFFLVSFKNTAVLHGLLSRPCTDFNIVKPFFAHFAAQIVVNFQVLNPLHAGNHVGIRHCHICPGHCVLGINNRYWQSFKNYQKITSSFRNIKKTSMNQNITSKTRHLAED